jgi:hypothetical protein
LRPGMITHAQLDSVGTMAELQVVVEDLTKTNVFPSVYLLPTFIFLRQMQKRGHGFIICCCMTSQLTSPAIPSIKSLKLDDKPSRFKSRTITRMPCPAKCSAQAFPRPDAPPVTTATLKKSPSSRIR